MSAAREGGEIVTYNGREYRVIAIDSHNVTSRNVYLEDVRTGQPLTVLLSDLYGMTGPRLRLVEPLSDDDEAA